MKNMGLKFAVNQNDVGMLGAASFYGEAEKFSYSHKKDLTFLSSCATILSIE